MGGYRLTQGDFQARFDPLGRLTHLGHPDHIRLRSSPFTLQGPVREGHWTVNCGASDIFFDPEVARRTFDLKRQVLRLDSSWRGPCEWYGFDLSRAYRIEQGLLRCDFSLRNYLVKTRLGDVTTAAPIQRLRYETGVNCWTDYSSDWAHRPYPTHLRCERDFFWGASVSPAHDVVGFFTATRADSWHVVYEGNGSQRIRSWCIDFINTMDAHPARLSPREVVLTSDRPSISGTFYAGVFGSLEEFFQKAADVVGAAFLVPETCAGFAGGTYRARVIGPARKPVTVRVADEAGGGAPRTVTVRDGMLELPFGAGFRRHILTLRAGGKSTEARVWQQADWKRPLATAARYACDVKRVHGYNSESILGLITVAQAAGLLGDRTCARKARAFLDEAYTVVYDRRTGRHKWGHNRLQNYGSLLDAIRACHRYLGTDEFLREGQKSAEQLLGLQGPDGNFYNHHVIYNNVVHPVKSLFDWGEHIRRMGRVREADRIHEAVGRAYANLVRFGDDTQTEGSDHFEDGMTSCAAYQIAGLWPHYGRRPEDLQVAIDIGRKRRALKSRVPDSRFFGSTLRHWEGYWACGLGQCMLGGHGWNCWSASMAHALFMATGDWAHIVDCYSTIANCVQAVDLKTGVFHFGFAIDPCWRDYVGLGRQYPGEEYVAVPAEGKTATEQHQVFLSLDESFFRDTYCRVDDTGIVALNGRVCRQTGNAIELESFALRPERVVVAAAPGIPVPAIRVRGAPKCTVLQVP